jgi:putative ABC transport system permease protein
MGDVIQDLRYGLRMLARYPGFMAAAVLTLGLGIGANTAIFSAVNAVLLRPLPYQNPSRLVRVWATNVKNPSPHDVASYPDFTDWRNQNHSFQQLAAYSGRSYNLTGGDHPERLNGERVSSNLLGVLGVAPALGRDFLPQEQQSGRGHVVLLSDALWRSHFAADPKIIGKSVKLNDESYTVIAVLPPQFRFPPDQHIALLVPLEPDPSRGHGFLSVVGRLRPGVKLVRAQAEMSAIALRLQREYPKNDKGVGIELQPMQASYVGEVRSALLILLGAVGFILLIACANVANLFVGRAAARIRELAVRASLGAARSRLVRQLLTESLLVGVTGGSLGLLLGAWGLETLLALLSRNFAIPLVEHLTIDRWVLAFTLLVSLLTGLVSGLAPALGASRVDLNESLKQGGRSLSGSLGRNRLRSALVISEVALALVLLSGAGLMVKSFALLTRVNSGLHPENVLAVNLSLRSARYSHTATRAALMQAMLHRVSSLPGVQSAAVAADVPLTDNTDALGFSIEGQPDPPGRGRDARFNIVGPGYFRTLGIPLLAGRDFTELDAESAPRVVLVNRVMVRAFWPHVNPIGQRITTDHKTWFTIIGVAGDVRQLGLQSESEPEVYVSYLQDPYLWPYLTMLIRSGSDPLKSYSTVEQAVWSVDHELPVSNPITMDQVRSNSIAQPRVTALLLGLFAALALTLACVGIYGVIARAVTERTHEIGVRMAIGARRVEVFRLVIGQGLVLALVGVGLGLAGAFAVTRVLANLLYDVRPTDPLTFSAVSLLLMALAAMASYVPARRATEIDPMVALRHE